MAKTEKVASAGVALMAPLDEQQLQEAVSWIAAGESSRTAAAAAELTLAINLVHTALSSVSELFPRLLWWTVCSLVGRLHKMIGCIR